MYIVFFNGIKVAAYDTIKAARAATVRKLNYIAKSAPDYCTQDAFSIFDSNHKRHPIKAEA